MSTQIINQDDNPPALQTTNFVSLIERLMGDEKYPVERIDKLLTMQREAIEWQAKMMYQKAIADLQAELPSVERKARGNNSMYAKFEHIVEGIKPAMAMHGFSITHRIKSCLPESGSQGKVTVTAVLSHSMGHSETLSLDLPIDDTGNKNSVQGVGSTIEYGRRYTTNALLGIATHGADNDGGSPRNQGGGKQLTQKQVKRIVDAINAAGITQQQFMVQAGIGAIHELNPRQIEQAVGWCKEVALGNAEPPEVKNADH